MYRTLVSFTVCPSFSFMFTDSFRTHFIFWPFTTVTLILNFSTSVMSFFLCAMCDDASMSPNHYLGSYSLFYSWNSTYNVAPTKRLLTSLYFSFTFFAQQSTALLPFFPQFLHFLLNQGFLAVLL